MEMMLSDSGDNMKPPSPFSPNQEFFYPHIVQGLEDLFKEKKMSNTGNFVDLHTTNSNHQRQHVLSRFNVLEHNKQQMKYSNNSTENLNLTEENIQISTQQETQTEVPTGNVIDILKQSWPPLPSHNNVADCPSQSSSSATESVAPSVNDLLDSVVDKTSIGGSGAFAGYARAVSIGFQHYNENTFSSATQFQPPHRNSQLLNNYPHSVGQQNFVSFSSNVECSPEEEQINCTIPLSHSIRCENSNVLQTIRTVSVHSNGRKECESKMEDPYTARGIHNLESEPTQQGSRLYQYFS